MVQENSLNSIIICGATASGKTDLAVSLAKKLNTEVISADSMLIYKGLDIGTAKPTVEEMQGIKHHLIDVVDVFDNFSVSDYEEKAAPILDGLVKNGKTPIVCGGTGFYINSLFLDLSYGKVGEDQKIRQKYYDLAEKYGNEYVHGILKEIDFKSAEEIHFNNLKRVIRAIEIYEISGTRKSDICDEGQVKRPFQAFMIDYPKEVLYDRIERRVNVMFERGLFEEVKKCYDLGVRIENQSMQGIGYKEFFDYFENKRTLNDVKESIILNTRHYAKRQITFFKKMKNLNFIKPNTLENLTNEILEKMNLK